MFRKYFTVVLLVGLAATVIAQDKTTGDGKDKKEDKEPLIVARPTLPKYFKSLGLTDEQKRKVFDVRTKLAAKIAELKKQIAQAEAKAKDDAEAILTDTQKARLKELKASGK